MFRVTLQPIGKCSVKNVSHGGLYWGVCRGTSVVSWEIGRERKVNSGAARYSTAPGYLKQADQLKSKYDAIIIGGGHNGLVAAAYLQKAGLDVCVLERRHLIGGAAVTEELVPGYKFSRASYLLSLLRPQVVQDLELKKFGLKVYIRDPNSYTPLLEEPGSNGRPRSLLLGRDKENNVKQISQFSTKDAQSFLAYEEQLDRIVEAIDPLLDSSPVHLPSWLDGTLAAKGRNWSSLRTLLKSMKLLKTDTTSFYELMTAPASKVLDKWFESEPLKATLATDSVIGAMTSPYNPGSGYVLLHHVMGELEGIKGAWGYVEGGMGAVSESIARSASSKGANIFVNMPVSKIDVTDSIEARGVVLEDGREIRSDIVLSNATAKVTYLDLIKKGVLAPEFTLDVSKIDFTSPVTKINMAVNKLPNFLADPNDKDDKPKPHHRCTIHLNCEHSEIIHQGYLEATQGKYSSKAVIEMTVPSSLDPTIAPPGCHVVQLFTQYTPYTLANGQEWTEQLKNEYADKVFDDIEQYAPGFKESVVGRDILTPPDLERVFGLTGGNIFHGSMSLDQLYFSRPTPAYSDYRSPVKKLYMCGSSAHPGGGVMGAPGRLGAMAALQDWKRR